MSHDTYFPFNMGPSLHSDASDANQNNHPPQPYIHSHDEFHQSIGGGTWPDFLNLESVGGMSTLEVNGTTQPQGSAHAGAQPSSGHPEALGPSAQLLPQQWAPLNAPNHSNFVGGNIGPGANGGHHDIANFGPPVQTQFSAVQGVSLGHPTPPTPIGPPTPMYEPSTAEGSSRPPSGGPPPPGLPDIADIPPTGAIIGIGEVVLEPYASWLYRAVTIYGQGGWLHEYCLFLLISSHPVSAQNVIDTGLLGSIPPSELYMAPQPALDSMYYNTHAQIMALYGPPSALAAPMQTQTRGTGCVQRTTHIRQVRQHAPYTTTTTNQAAATGAVLERNNTRSTGASRKGGARSKGAGGKGSLRPSTANAVAGPSSASTPSTSDATLAEALIPSELSPRASKKGWMNEEREGGFTGPQKSSLDGMCRVGGLQCTFPECPKQGDVYSSHQKRNEHVMGQHLDTLKEQCEHCEGWYSRKDAVKTHQKTGNKRFPCKTLKREFEKTHGKGKGKALPVDEEDDDDEEEVDVAEDVGFQGWPKGDDDDNTGSGGMGGMFMTNSFSGIHAY
ncbi:unnamed protein product [Peniophora sp. CBMAI 1063]|nr:unnamed protein product [Peniophora sp. CBMAI 1063]